MLKGFRDKITPKGNSVKSSEWTLQQISKKTNKVGSEGCAVRFTSDYLNHNGASYQIETLTITS